MDAGVETVLDGHREIEPQTGSESVALLQPIQPKQLLRIPVREKTMPASTPGSEYWLP
jgi:hypothetical protein